MSLPPGELLIKLQVTVSPAEQRGLCHLNPITLDVAIHNADRKNRDATHGNRTSTAASEENNAALQWPGCFTLSQLVRHMHRHLVTKK